MDMGIEAIEHSGRTDLEHIHLYEEGIEREEYLIDAIADLYQILLVYHQLISNEEEQRRVENLIWLLTSKWVELISPIRYVPGLVTDLSSRLSRKLWDILGIDIDLVGRIIRETYMVKKGSLEALHDLRNDVVEFLEMLGVDHRYYQGLINGKPDELITLIVLTLVLSTNIYGEPVSP